MRKLVKLGKDGYLTEVDTKAMRREALVLQRYIDEAPEDERKLLRYDEWLRPVVDAAIHGSLPIPYTREPYNIHLMLEGVLPELPQPLLGPYARFVRRITGAARFSIISPSDGQEEVIDGERYQWVTFED